MSYINVYPSRINWENEPNISTPLNATNLNKTDYALYSIDQTLAGWDTSKANQSDLLLCVKSIDFDDETGVFVFTWQNGTTKTIDLNIEKIPVSFSMDANGVITMTTDDGTTYTADVGALIKTYTFTDSTTIDFTVTTDASGNKTITADIIDGSITGSKLQPNYLADCQTAATNSSNSANASAGSSSDSEAWAVGTRGGVPVPSTDPAYNNNSYYWSQHGASSSLAGLTDTDITSPQDGQLLGYDSSDSKWKNVTPTAGGGSKIEVTTAETTLYGKTVTITDGTTTLTETFDNSGNATFTGVTLTGNLTISATDGTSTSTKYLTVPYFGNYSVVLSFFTATITATFPSNHGATCTCDGQTSSSSPHNFTVNSAGTYNVVCTLDGISKTETVTITTDGQTESRTFEYGTINLTYGDDFRGQTITCVNGGTTITKTAPSSGNTMVFYPPTTGTWTISGTVSGTSYSTTATISSLSTPVSASLESIPDGSTATPTDDIQTWLECAGITDKAYTLLSEVLADTDTYVTLLGDSNACDYMARSTTWSTDIVADADAMRLLGMYDYACDALLGNATWASAIAGSTYVDYVLDVSVPKMTSNTAPSGTAGASMSSSSYPAWKAFDRDDTSYAYLLEGTNSENYIFYQFTSPVCIKKLAFIPRVRTYPTHEVTYKLQGSSDGSTWTDIYTKSAYTAIENTEESTFVNNDNCYQYYRLWFSGGLANSSATYFTYLYTVQFVGRKTNNVDIIHSAPSDTIYYLNNGSPVTLCTTDANGIGEVDWSDLPTGDITLYSSVAKNPTDLTADYSKTITVTKNKVEAYLMPDNALYWYGYELYPMVAQAVSGGSSSVYTGKLPTLTRNTNNFFTGFSSSQSGTNQGTVYINHATNLTPFSRKKIIFDAIVVSGVYRALYEYSSPSYSTGSYSSAVGLSSFTPSSATSNRFLRDVDISGETSTVYEIFVTETASGSGAGYSNCTVSAVWYE